MSGSGGSPASTLRPCTMLLNVAAFVGVGLSAELRSGVIERMRVTPMSRAAMLLGRSLRDVVILRFQARAERREQE